nr:MAG TPA: hypothetical protein [Caudoviricetes sp.]
MKQKLRKNVLTWFKIFTTIGNILSTATDTKQIVSTLFFRNKPLFRGFFYGDKFTIEKWFLHFVMLSLIIELFQKEGEEIEGLENISTGIVPNQRVLRESVVCLKK